MMHITIIIISIQMLYLIAVLRYFTHLLACDKRSEEWEKSQNTIDPNGNLISLHVVDIKAEVERQKQLWKF